AHAAASLDAREVRSFRARHAVLLEMMRRQRTPSLAELPAPQDWSAAIVHAGNGELLEGLQATSERMNAMGFRLPSQVVLAACGAPGGAVEVIPGGLSTIVLFLDRN